MEKELNQQTHEQIVALCKKGDGLVDNKDYGAAIETYREAWNLVPKPQTEWEASTWILTAIADAYLFNGDFDYVVETLEYCIHCPNALGNPYIHLRLGQSYFELNNKPKAGDQLARAFMGAGQEIFDNQDSKYFEYLRTIMDIQ